MANPYFQFKKFTIWHDKCAMKVGTDGVLLGSWVNINQCHHILDIGTGTGLIAMMLAQRSTCSIDAIDIDTDACTQAKENVKKSSFKGRINIYQSSLQEFIPYKDRKYNLIVSNPPYFINSVKCPNYKRNIARHTDFLSINDLLKYGHNLLTPNGRIALILPFDQRMILLHEIEKAKLHVIKETHVYPTPQNTPKRLLIEIGEIIPDKTTVTSLIIEQERHQYTEEFKLLAKDFYLKI